MNLHTKILFQFAFFSAVLLNSCSNTKFLTKDEILYSGRKDIHITGNNNKREVKPAKSIAEEITYFEPNNSVLGKRILPPLGLWTFNYRKPDDGKKPGWIYRNLAKSPILITSVDPEQRTAKLESDLFKSGYFKNNTWFELDTLKNHKKAKISYFIDLDSAYLINSIKNPPPQCAVDSLINGLTTDFALKTGDIFNIDKIKTEKQRMSAKLVEQGYYFFSPEYIDIIADTTQLPFRINLLIRKNPETPPFILKTYSINNISVVLKGVDFNSTLSNAEDSVYFDGITIRGDIDYLKPEVITRSILFRKGDTYTTRKHYGTIPLLNNYGVFEYAKMQFAVADSASQTLDLVVELKAKKEVSLNFEANVQSKSTGFAGPMSEIAIAHSNIAKGANRLQVKVFGGFEWQWGNRDVNDLGANSYNAGINSSYVIPKLLVPFKNWRENEAIIAKTVGSLGFEFVNNVTYYRMNSINMGFGYQWNKQKKISHMLKPFRVNLVSLLQTTPEFDSIVNSNPYVKKSFEEQSIFGSEYQFTFDNANVNRNSFYFQGNIGTSGNLIDVIKQIGNEARPYTLLGNVYSQFIKLSFDLRYYTINQKKGLALRLYTGTGYSYGNSTVMPYIEQFYSGGSNSLRGFVARSLGPGSYKPEEYNGIIDQTGDIKLEFNAEYRFPLSKIVHGALFLESGNVWLVNEDENRPGSGFQFDTFANQLAVGTGLGLRFDFNFFVLRTDLGFPLRTPYETDNTNWLNISDVFKGWRFNLAIGFPY